jgi:Zn-finger nucleic acid-binding protein
MHCPICKTEKLLLIDDLSGHVDGRCAKCSGRWLSFREAVNLGYVTDSETQAAGLSVANCPRCLEKSLVYTATAVPVSIRPLRCLPCDGIWVSEDLMHKVRNKSPKHTLQAFEKKNEKLSIEELLQRNSVEQFIDKKSENNPVIQFLAVPIAAAIVWLLCKVGIFAFLQDVLLGMPAHELGHAVAQWLMGRFAVPIPFVTIPISDTNIFAFLLTLLILVFSVWKGYQQRLFFWVLIGVIGLYLMLAKGLFSDDSERAIWASYSGIGGEFVLGTLGVIAYFYTINHKPSWNYTRYAVLFFGMLIFLPAWFNWVNIAAGSEPFPLGSLLFGKEEGDMNSLLEHGMTIETVTESYLALGRWCFAMIGLHLAVSAVKAYKFLTEKNK